MPLFQLQTKHCGCMAVTFSDTVNKALGGIAKTFLIIDRLLTSLVVSCHFCGGEHAAERATRNGRFAAHESLPGQVPPQQPLVHFGICSLV